MSFLFSLPNLILTSYLFPESFITPTPYLLIIHLKIKAHAYLHSNPNHKVIFPKNFLVPYRLKAHVVRIFLRREIERVTTITRVR